MSKALKKRTARGGRKKLTRAQTEPALVRAGIVSMLGLLAGLGVGWAADVDDATIGRLALAWIVLAPLVQGWWTRHGVTAARAVLAWVTTRGEVVAGEAALAPTGTEVRVAPANPATERPAVTAQIRIQPGLVE